MLRLIMLKELGFNNAGKYNNGIFRRVIDGFMAQTGDVKFGKSDSSDFNLKWLVWEVLIFLI